MESLQNILITTLAVSSLFAMGLELPWHHLTRALLSVRTQIIALAANFVLIPALAFGLTTLLATPSPVTVGVILCAVAPAGSSGAMLTMHARGDNGLAVSLSVALKLLSLVLTPPLLQLLVGARVQVPIGPIVTTLLLYQLVPLALGMVMRNRLGRLAKWPGRIATACFAVLVVGLTATQGDQILVNGWVTIAIIAVCVLASLGSAWLVPGAAIPQRAAFALTAAIRNLSLALLLAAQHFPDRATTLAILTYSLLMFVAAVPLALWWGRREEVKPHTQ